MTDFDVPMALTDFHVPLIVADFDVALILTLKLTVSDFDGR